LAQRGKAARLDCPKCRAVNSDSSRYCGSCASPLVPPEPPSDSPSDSPSLTTTIDPLAHGLLAGTVIAGKYRLLGEIGRGGMGIVYEADDLKLRRPVALKFLPTELTDDVEARERFIHEAQAASVLDNPHICTIHEIGESEDRRMFIAMALCNGESLRAKIKRGPLPPAEALSIAVQIADGLAAAHASGIIHRDVKPANILVTKEGAVRIADFGLAKITGEARLTRAGHAVGTVAYMAPEQLRGEEVDARTDVWSLGVVLYEMLTGALPFRGTTEHSLAYAIVNSEPKPLALLPPGTPTGCTAILEKALAKDRADRFASAVELAEALAAVRESAGYSGHLRTASRANRLLPPHRPALVRLGLPTLAVAAILAVALALHVPTRIAILLGLARPAGGRHITVFTPNVIGDSPEDRVLAAGLAEFLRVRLDEIARRSRSWVTPGENLDSYEVREATDALRVLGSNVVLSGTFKRVGDNLSLTLDVIDPASYRRVSSLSKSDYIANIATWQVDLVYECAAALGLADAPSAAPPRSTSSSASASSSPGPERVRLNSTGTTVPGAFESYLRGLGFMTAVYSAPGPSLPAYSGALASAITLFEEAVRLDPSFSSAGIELADAYRRKAVDPASPATDPSPAQHAETVIRAVLKSNDDSAPAHLVCGAILRALGRNDEAALELERAVALDPLDYDAHIGLGLLYEDTNQPAKAEAAYRDALGIRPGYWAGASYLGIFYLYRGAYDNARKEFEAAARVCPGNINVLNYLGTVEYKLGAFDRAMAAYERSNTVKRNADACGNLAVIYYYSGRYADSVNMGQIALSFGPTDFSNLIWGNLGDAYRFTPGNEAKAAEAYQQAIELTERALAVDPGDSRSRASLAAFLAKAGDPVRARAEIERVLREKPDDSSIVMHAVMVYEVGGARGQALEAVREYVRLKGSMDEIVRDPFLAGLRQDPGYADIIRK
jgi:tetratricopeptide (TPR) repeat protein